MSTKLTDEELLAIVSSQKDSPLVTQGETNVPLFISTFGLEEGTLKIPARLIYRLYKLWSAKGVGEDAFFKQLSLYLPNKCILEGSMVAYLLNKDTFKLNEEIYRLIKDKPKAEGTANYYKVHFETFTKSSTIVDGSDWISSKDLYNTYLNWAKPRYTKNQLSLKNFQGFCKLYFNVRGSPIEVAINKELHEKKKESDNEIKAKKTK